MIRSNVNDVASLIDPQLNSENTAEFIDYAKSKNSKQRVSDHSAFLSADPKMEKIKEIISQIAPTPVSVLISGESGTGKEVIARYIHNISDRAKEPFVAVNCAALPPSLLESELFGFEKGAFTGAHQRHIGKFEQATKGTLLLDEVTEIDLNLQAKLLRALQEKEVERIGGRESIKIDTRIIATTNRDIEKSVANGSFRQDLYYRLHVIPLEIPPLRKRPKDIELLANYFLKKFEKEYSKSDMRLSHAALEAMLLYRWPGNVRELQNIIHRALLMSSSSLIDANDLPISFESTSKESWIASLPIGSTLRKLETEFILETLRYHQGNRTHASRTLGISLRTLRNKINEFTGLGIDVMAPQGSNNHD
ncbi:MAG: sigma-54-dependent Fis family transcriptional regulator [Oligoflexales bacterium]|nr:sigma-54-dependent Fis family transcriptional regulator [Oligoflexales bacterium]